MSTYLSWFWQASRGSRFQIAMGAMAGIAHVAVSMVFVYACKTLVDIATGVSDKNLLEYTLLLIAVILGQITFSALKNRLAARNDIILKNNLRYRLFSHVMSVCYDGRKGRQCISYPDIYHAAVSGSFCILSYSGCKAGMDGGCYHAVQLAA